MEICVGNESWPGILGAYVIAYILDAVFIGTPMYFLEVALGQFTQSGAIGVFNLIPALKVSYVDNLKCSGAGEICNNLNCLVLLRI